VAAALAALQESAAGPVELEQQGPRHRRRLVAAGALLLALTGAVVAGILLAGKNRKGEAATRSKSAGVVPLVPELPPDAPPPPKGGEPISSFALVCNPARIEGVRGWTIETVRPRGLLTVAYSPDGKQLAAACADGVIRLYEGDGARLVRMWVAHGGTLPHHKVLGLAWRRGGKVLASIGDDGWVRLWDVGIAWQLRQVKLDSLPFAVAWSADGATLVVGLSSRKVELIDPGSGKRRGSLAVPDSAPRPPDALWAKFPTLAWIPDGNALTIRSPDGKRVYSGDSCWDARSGKPIWKGQHHGVRALSPDGKTIAATIGTDRLVFVDADTGKHLAGVPLGTYPASSACASWRPDGKRLAVAKDTGAVDLYDPHTAQLLMTFEGACSYKTWYPPNYLRLEWPSWSPDGRMIAGSWWDGAGVFDVASGKPLYNSGGIFSSKGLIADPWGNFIAIQDGATGKLMKFINDLTLSLNSLTWSPDGKAIALFNGNKTGLLDIASGKITHQLGGAGGLTAWSPDGTRIAVFNGRGGSPGLSGAHVCSTATGKRQQSLSPTDGSQKCAALAWSPDGTLLATGWGDGIVRVWDPATAKPLHKLPGHTGQVVYLAWAKDGKTLLSDSEDGTHRVWHLPPEKLPEIRPWRMYAPSPDLRLGAVGDLNTIRLHEIANNRPVGVLMLLPGRRLMCIHPEGHYRGSPGVERDLRYVAQLPDGSQVTLTPAEFEKRFGWKNDPEKVRLIDR
jgi:WD40 repeat protein